MIKPLNDIETLVEIISNALQKPKSEVVHKLLQEAKTPGYNVDEYVTKNNVPRNVMSDKMEELYKYSDGFTYESTIFNTCEFKEAMRSYIHEKIKSYKKEGTKVFCYGDACGFDSAYFAKFCGCDLSYYEPCVKSQQIARKVFHLNNVQVNMLESLESIQEGAFDIIVCFDVLEHVPNPQDQIKSFSKWLSPDGILFVHAPFWFVSPKIPTHLLENKKYSGTYKTLYGDVGFEPIEACYLWNPIVFQKKNSPNKIQQTLFQYLYILLGSFILTFGRTPISFFGVMFALWYNQSTNLIAQLTTMSNIVSEQQHEVKKPNISTITLERQKSEETLEETEDEMSM